MTLASDLDNFLDPILAAFTDSLQALLNGFLATAYLRGSAQMVQWGRTKLTDRPIFFEGPLMQQAIDYATQHCATLVKGLNEETKTRLAEVIGNAIEEKRGIDGLARDLRAAFKTFTGDEITPGRARMIARTETCDALEQAFLDRADDMGITGKEWVAYDPCSDCEDNEAEGIVPIDHVFSSGHDRPPAHPNCRCALAPVMLKGRNKEGT